jgi:hypothetical protein
MSMIMSCLRPLPTALSLVRDGPQNQPAALALDVALDSARLVA